MGQTLKEIAEILKASNKKVQLIYAFNGIGKTRLSREFKNLVAPKNPETEEDGGKVKVMYYNAFTEDLFYWDNDLDYDTYRKLKIQPNNYTKWVLEEQGQESNIVTHFQHYTNDKLTPIFNAEYTTTDKEGKSVIIKANSEISFSIDGGNIERIENIKISKGEESNLIWCVFYSLLEQVVEVLNDIERQDLASNQFKDLKYIFIDDPVSSLDDNHLIELAVNLAELIKKSIGLNFIISTHNPLFYNVLFNELGNKVCYMLNKLEDNTYTLKPTNGDSNKSFSYHLHLKQTIEEAIKTETVQKYHFMLLRNLYEKTANFFGYPEWKRLLPEDRQLYYNRIVQFTSHSTLSNEVIPEPTEPEKQTLRLLFEHLINSKYWNEEIVAAAPVLTEV